MKVLLMLVLAVALPAHADTLRIGSKRFTESYILGELLAETARRAGTTAEHRPGLGNTAIVYAALKAGSIDLYPDYTGTIARELLKQADDSLAAIDAALAREGLGASVRLGFENTYAIAMREADATRLAVAGIGDLARHPRLKLGLSHEFLGRADGWTGLRIAYRLPFATPIGLDHGIAFEALAAGRIDAIDVYSTDAKIARYALRVLADDRGYFPKYDAVLVYRRDVAERFPAAWKALRALQGRIDAQAMIGMNAAAELEGRSFGAAAALFFDAPAPFAGQGFWARLLGPDLARLTREHVLLAFGSLLLAIVVGVPLGVAAARAPRLGAAILAVVGVIQTIPSLAMLAFLIAIAGRIGFWPALVALFLYALLPIVRNTQTGLVGVRTGLVQAALALGLSARDRLLSIELPLAWPAILAGIKTAAVINTGTATIAAFVGAGGYGERIAQGLATNDTTMLLAGAIPAALLALATELAFALWQRRGTRAHV